MKNIFKKILAIFIGIIIFFLLLESSLRLLSIYQKNKNIFIKFNNKKNNELRILTLGDSMTALGGEESYSKQLEKILNNAKKTNKKIRVINEGVVRTDSSDILLNLKENIIDYKPDIVIVMTGINDHEKYSQGIRLISNYKIADNNFFLNYFNSYNFYLFIKKNIEINFLALKYEKNNKNSKLDKVYYELGRFFIKKGIVEKGIYYLNKAISENKKNDLAYQEIAVTLQSKYSFEERKKLCLKAIEINPYRIRNHLCLRTVYSAYDKKNFKVIHDILLNGLRFNPKSPDLLFGLGSYYYAVKDFQNAEKYFLEALNYANDFDFKMNLYQLLSKIYFLQNNLVEYEKFNILINSLDIITNPNYKEISSILSSHNIPLVAVQYPRRDVSILKTYLKDKPNTYFVDNNESFEKAIEKYGYDYLFIDKFAGDFGHGSKYGNQLIAENVAKVILEEVLKHE